jgi:hypothetical protein
VSFDLEFISRNGKPAPTMNAITVWAETQPNISIENEGEDGKISYENYDTGVHFTIYRSNEVLHLNINYCRPTFFALETAAVMGTLVSDFSLLVNDPDDEDAKKIEYDADALIEWWKEGNHYGCKVLKSIGQDVHWMEESKTTELWHYLRERSQIVEEYDEYFVPKVSVVLLDDRVLRGAHLTRPTYYVVPPVDIFWLQNGNIVSAERVLSVLKPYLTKLEGFDGLNAVSEDTCFDTDVMDVWESMYDALTPDFEMSQIEGKGLGMDGFVDVNL